VRRTTHAGLPALKMRTRADWRAWLEANHASVDAMWLVFPRKALGKPGVRYEEAVEEALCFGWIDGVLNKLDAGWYAIRFTPRKPKSIWSKANVERVERMMRAGLMAERGRTVYEAAVASGAVAAAYAVKDAVALPQELADALQSDTRAPALFASLSESQRRMWMRWVLSVKQPASRRKKAAEAVALMLAGWKAGETDAMAARRGLPARAEILARQR
jgi:uncharacterized protein YdeI (YjbR/CyaY-like superfamily)